MVYMYNTVTKVEVKIQSTTFKLQTTNYNSNFLDASSVIILAIAREEVAPGEGALRT